MKMIEVTHPSSFRDPSGFLYRKDGHLYRQINPSYRREFDKFISSGLYGVLANKGLLIRHQLLGGGSDPVQENAIVIEPEMVPFISYPYEWCFSQYQDAALLTLDIQQRSMDHGMSLKDASAYNIQFHNGKPIMIDTLSFETYVEGQPWVAYQQFCQHFLAPLALMAKVDVRLGQLMRVYIDGIPLNLASRLLPWKTRLNFGLASHIHMHAAAQKRAASATAAAASTPTVSKTALKGIIDNLKTTILSLHWQPEGTTWGDYYDSTNYSDQAFEEKRSIVTRFLERISPKTLWDLGANTGVFSRIAGEKGIHTVAFDIDPAGVELNYLECKKNHNTGLLPLMIDLTNPSAASGWANQERDSLLARGPVDMIFALALVHHLAITNNVPLVKIAELFSSLGQTLVIEFVPKSDSQVQRMLSNRRDIFAGYTLDGFENAFKQYYRIVDQAHIEGSERELYLMERS
jgi:ribosomal protein L11 methylase PrmA